MLLLLGKASTNFGDITDYCCSEETLMMESGISLMQSCLFTKNVRLLKNCMDYTVQPLSSSAGGLVPEW